VAREQTDASAVIIFGARLDWEAWTRKPDLRLLQQVFDRNPEIRNNFARAFAAQLRDRHFETMADMAVGAITSGGPRYDEVLALLERHLLNWPSFQGGNQDDVFLSALRQDYELREEIAHAVEFPSDEVQELARGALVLWMAESPGRWYSFGRRQLLRRLRSSEDIRTLAEGNQLIELFEDLTPLEWEAKQTPLARLFAHNPMVAAALWNAMEWPRPFGLVLREELRQIE